MKNFSPKWSSVFEDATGGYSMMRVLFAFVTISIMITWMFACFLSTPVTLLTMPKELVGLIVGFGGVKTFQRFAENGKVEEVILEDKKS